MFPNLYIFYLEWIIQEKLISKIDLDLHVVIVLMASQEKLL